MEITSITEEHFTLSPKELRKKENAIKRIEYMKVYMAEYRPKYYSEHRTEIINKQKEYNKVHSDLVKEKKREWYLKRKEGKSIL